MSKKSVVLIVGVLCAILLAVTCPGKQEHQEAVRYALSSAAEEEMATRMSEDSNGWNAIGSMVGSLLADKFIGVFIDQHLHVDSYVFVSVGELSYMGKSKTVSFGILNKVFTFSKEDLQNAMKESNEEKESSEDNGIRFK